MIEAKPCPLNMHRRQSYSDWRHDRHQQMTGHIGRAWRLNDFRSERQASLKSFRGMDDVGIDSRNGHKRFTKIRRKNRPSIFEEPLLILEHIFECWR